MLRRLRFRTRKGRYGYNIERSVSGGPWASVDTRETLTEAKRLKALLSRNAEPRQRNPAPGYGTIGTGGFKNATEAALSLIKRYGKHALGYARDYYTVASRVADKKFWNVVYNFIYDEMEGVQTNPRRKTKRRAPSRRC